MPEPAISNAHSLGPYQLIAEIGRGGMADVYLALGPQGMEEPSRVVIKRLRSDVLEDDEFRAMFLEEARLAQKLDHPNVVKTSEVGRDGEACFIVMEFLDGQPLSRIRRHGRHSGSPIPLAIHLRLMADVLSGLHYVHELKDHDGLPLGIVHRDVTPQNVFVTYDGQVKVVDFGIAKARARQFETRVGVVKGKLSYIAPENVAGAQVDRRSDIFSVGIMLWEAATGRRFWAGMDELAIYHALISGKLPTESGRADMLPQLWAIISRALDPNPAHRFATAAQMKSALDALSTNLTASKTAVSGYLYQLFAEERRKFHELVDAELTRLENGYGRHELPDLRPESIPSAILAERTDIRNATTVRPGAAQQSGMSSTTMRTTFASQNTPTLRPRASRRIILLSAGAAVLSFVAFILIRGDYASRAAAPPARATIEAPSPVKEPAAIAPPPVTTTSATPQSPAPIVATYHPPAPPARPSIRRPEPSEVPTATPSVSEELRREPRRRRSLDAEDPWAR